MSIPYAIVALLAGWCGTPYPRRWKFPWPFPTPDAPWPPPPICPVCGPVLGSLGGVIVQIAVASLFPHEVNLTTALLTGFIGGRLTNDLLGTVMPGKFKG